ncbi:hypothetical protein DAPPUDRAFT_99799 [Daphnia pulex]|uniref:Ionotropic glutamate receptor L-glutamate and glycine-binding domain-containing protein n=1 Tax=Daphnia pulex TaxID=6669 RepID=E9G8B7_DAPPU|nr:hypothetical protein DAPPUDRAFT_99799 [Daphnia pulex]|eukprot:EFX84302.1 hypothetical protein DAPPUDRAFT_99799 [Daphnia pulex]
MEGFIRILVLLSALQFKLCTSENRLDRHKHLKVEFIHELADRGRFQWKSLTVLFTKDAIDDNSDWIFDVKVPKVMMELPTIDDSFISIAQQQPTDAYLILISEQSTEMAAINSVLKLFVSKQLDSTKTCLIFSAKSAAILNRENDLDLILVQDTVSWNSNTGLVNKPILKFVRHRSLSSMEPEQLTGYYDGGILKADQKRILFDRSINYRNRQVKVTTFLSPPTTIRCKDGIINGHQMCGRDPNLIRVIGEVLHFRPVFSSPAQPGSKWGNKLDNGEWTGLIGEVSRGVTTLGVANVFMTVHYIEQVEFSYPYDMSCSTFLTPSPELWPQLYALIKPFDLSIWLATVFSLVIGGLLIQLVALVYHKMFGSRDPLRFFGEAMIYNAQSITGTRSGSDERSSWPVRVYTSNWWLFCFLLGTVYRTGLISWLARSPILMAPVDTIAQLVRSDLTPYGYNTFVRDLAQYSIDPDTIQLGGRLKLVPPNMTAQLLMGQENVNAIFENKQYLKYLSVMVVPSTMGNISINSVDPRQRLHVMRECLRSFPVAIAMTPGTPFRSAMTQIIHQLNAAGIIDHWLDSVVQTEVAFTTKRYKKKEPFSLHSLEGVFYLLLICYSIDVVAFVAELVYHRVSCRHFLAGNDETVD